MRQLANDSKQNHILPTITLLLSYFLPGGDEDESEKMRCVSLPVANQINGSLRCVI